MTLDNAVYLGLSVGGEFHSAGSMAEQVARALAKQEVSPQCGWTDEERQAYADEFWQNHLADAMAAIAAMQPLIDEAYSAAYHKAFRDAQSLYANRNHEMGDA